VTSWFTFSHAVDSYSADHINPCFCRLECLSLHSQNIYVRRHPRVVLICSDFYDITL